MKNRKQTLIDPQAVLPPENRDILVEKLLAWYEATSRSLPWRPDNCAPANPYNIWISEIMLQQTTVATVRQRFDSFVNRWPTINKLASASVDEVLHEWQGLGYYSRAHNLHKCARIICSRFRGKFPSDTETLLSLPGIGPYTAAAIAAIAFGKPCVPVDVNVERVLLRLFAIDKPAGLVKQTVLALAGLFAIEGRSSELAQALMDLGATVCKSTNPTCSLCPWANDCLALSAGLADKLPIRPKKKLRPTRYGIVFVADRPDGAILLRRRADKGLFAGMMEFPSTPWDQKQWTVSAASKYAPFSSSWRDSGVFVKHSLTHFHLELSIFTSRAPADSEGLWVLPLQLGRYALPTVMKKVASAAGYKL